MYNVMLDPLPSDWNGYQIDSDFRTGIQLCMALEDKSLSDMEKGAASAELLFPLIQPEMQEIPEATEWFLSGWNLDNIQKNNSTIRILDFNIDQWRIYSAFKHQYGIDLHTADLHYWQFMGLLTTLEECAFTRVIDIRQKKIKNKMSKEEKEAIIKAKQMYSLGDQKENLSEADKEKKQEAIELFEKMRKAKS